MDHPATGRPVTSSPSATATASANHHVPATRCQTATRRQSCSLRKLAASAHGIGDVAGLAERTDQGACRAHDDGRPSRSSANPIAANGGPTIMPTAPAARTRLGRILAPTIVGAR